MRSRRLISRRAFFARIGAGGLAARGFAAAAPAIVLSERERPQLPSGVMSGDVGRGRAVLWSRTDRPARMIVELAGDEEFSRVLRRIDGPAVLAEDDFTARLQLSGLPEGERLHYRIRFQDLAEPRLLGAPATGSFRTGGGPHRPIAFTFAGDEGGQGWGINPEFGGYRLYEAMRRMGPDFFIHSGDQIYADSPIPAERVAADGRVWRNLVTEAKSRPAQSLAEFRGAYAYNLLDENKRRFTAEVPFLVQWDDHEVRNNWWPGQMLTDPRYEVSSVSLLAARARRAMFDFNPIHLDPHDPERIYRAFNFGPSLDVLMLDERSYRGPNSPNMQAEPGPDADFLGPAQLRWLKRRLLASRATWKVIASDMPLSLVNEDNARGAPPGTYESWPNADDGPPRGRELEIADLLAFAQANRIRNLVWVTADVHFAAAYHYAPERAAFTRFDPFWEFVAGPISASTFGPNALDMTFGPEERFLGVPRTLRGGRSPFDGLQFFGLGRIDPSTEALTMSLHDIDGKELYKVTLEPEIA
jgi:alkaline phosphatase D